VNPWHKTLPFKRKNAQDMQRDIEISIETKQNTKTTQQNRTKNILINYKVKPLICTKTVVTCKNVIDSNGMKNYF
jgi:hypothetical protein